MSKMNLCWKFVERHNNTLCLKIQLEWKVIDSKMKSKPIDSVVVVGHGADFKSCRQGLILIPSTAHNASEDAGWSHINQTTNYTEYWF